MNQYPSWTQEELKILTDNYPIMGQSVYKLLPNRSFYSVVTKASRLKLKPIYKIDLINFDEVVRLVKSGLKVKDACKKLGFDQATLHKFCVKNGLSIRSVLKKEYLFRKSNTGKKQYCLNQIQNYNLQKDYKSCCVCGWNKDSVDFAHIVPARHGGEYTISNIVPLCPNHHRLYDKNKLSKEDITFIEQFNAKMAQMAAKGGKK